MASLDVTRLMNNARVHLPGAIDSNLQLELFNVLTDFFQDSNIWQEEITFAVKAVDPVDTVYYVEQTSVSMIIRLLNVRNSAGRTVGATMQNLGEIRLQYKAGQDDTYTATVALTISDPVAKDGFPEFPPAIFAKYSTGILEGVLGRMMAQPAKPWTNDKKALFYLNKMRGTTSTAKIEALHRNVNNGQTWRFPRSFATTRR